ncbi:MAG: hypothetical protein KC645_11870, partial [Gemmatimonadetes bacterium]|nr:hypothetical protein [Gemmatimonadota bacterium]
MPLRVPPLVFCGILASASAAALPLAAQEPERPDSSDLRGDARSAQSAFERLRVRRLPRELMGSGGCDEVIGRICMRHDGDDDFVPPPEDEDITEGRERLLAELADIGRAIPGDDWVLGQRVWYAIEAGRPEEAIELPRPCAATPWWCAALEGLALHAAERFEDAERAFGRALQAMPEETRAAWDDATEDVLGRERLGWLEEQPDRDAALERFWRLADPSWMMPGNDRRTAHWARLTASGIRDRARNAYGLSWGFDLEELLVRYGWEIAWGRDVWRAGQMEDRVVGHHPPRSLEYAPPEPVLADPAAT